MDNNNYFEKRSLNAIKKIKELTENLPYFCEEFFIGIENRTSPLTRLNYAYDLRIFFDFLINKKYKNKHISDIELKDIENLTVSDLEYFLSYLTDYSFNGNENICSETGKARKLSTIRSFYKYYFNKGSISANTASKLISPKLHEKEIIRLESNDKVDEISGIINVADLGYGLSKKQMDFHNKTRIRDVAILTLFLGSGIRISELIGLNYDDIDFKNKSFVVTRKGGNRTILYFNDEVKASLEDYVIYKSGIKEISESEKAMFLSLRNTRISTRTVENLVKKYAKIASPLKKITPHKLRSTFGTNLYKATGDIYMVADCLGHKDVNTTKKHYAAITEDVRKRASYSVTLRDKTPLK